MSWSFSANNVPKAGLELAIDSAKATGQDADLPGMAEDQAAAKTALKILAPRVKRDNVTFSASGHCLQPDESKNHSDCISVSCYGSDPV